MRMRILADTCPHIIEFISNAADEDMVSDISIAMIWMLENSVIYWDA